MLLANKPAVQRTCIKLGLSTALLVAPVIPFVAAMASTASVTASCHNAAGVDTFDLSCAPPTVASDLFNEQNVIDATIPGQSATHAGGGSTDSGDHTGGLNAATPSGNVGIRTGTAHAGFSPHAGLALENATHSAGHR
jgi:hypothetical protein